VLKKLLGSRTRINILKLFVLNPKQDYYVREIARLTKEPFDPARKELAQLEFIGLLKSRVSGRQKYYSVNTDHVLFPEFKLIILKTVGIGDAIRSEIDKRGDIIIAFIYGSYAKDMENIDSDIDLFVVGDISSMDLQEIISGIEAETKREINSTIYSSKELKVRYKTKNNFVTEVFKGPKIFLKGDENGFRKLVSAGQAS
jgi:predicted nucleotidyltransferase